MKMTGDIYQINWQSLYINVYVSLNLRMNQILFPPAVYCRVNIAQTKTCLKLHEKSFRVLLFIA